MNTTNTDVLFLVRNSLAATPVWRWLNPGSGVRIVTQPSAVDVEVPKQVELVLVAEYDQGEQVEMAVRRAHMIRPCTHLEIVSEWDVLRAARLREYLGLGGQNYRSATAYRDKAEMKDWWAAHGVPAADHTRIEMPCDLVEFADWAGPIVVKPRRAAGSLGVAVLRTASDVRTWLAHHWRVRPGEFSPWIAEQYVDGRMLQVDGLYDHGELHIAWPTEISSLLSWQHQDGAPVHATMLDADDPAVQATQKLVREAIAALPTPPRTAFHAEVWMTARGLLMNEIAARVGGAGTAAMIEAAFGVNLHRAAVRASVYHERIGAAIPARPHNSAGYAMVPRRAGRIARIDQQPASLHQPWLTHCSIRVAAGETSAPPRNSVDAAALFVAIGHRRDQVAERLALATDWARRAIVYERHTASNAA